MSLKNISLSFGGEAVLDNLSFNILKGEHIALVGRNGSGKSTLLKVISGLAAADSGDVASSRSLKTAYLPQDIPALGNKAVTEALQEYAPSDRQKLLSFLTRLGVAPNEPYGSLSGGMKRRALLAGALAAEPDLLLLDEPTNHLDVPSIEWLEGYLSSFRGAILFVTHDRAFLRKTATKIVELDRGALCGWDCGYDTFLERKKRLLEDEEQYYAKMGRRLCKEEAWLRRGVKARRARNEGRARALEALRSEFGKRREEEGKSRLAIRQAEKSGDRVLRFKDVSFAYPGGRTIVRNLSFDLLRGERIGIIGGNGCGKSTLVKLALGFLKPGSGEVEAGTKLSTVYFDQLGESLDPELSIAENLVSGSGADAVYPGGVRRSIYSYLEDFLFAPERAASPVKALSGGEKSRLALAKLFLRSCNLLVLDEPTNDLDVETLELLEEQISLFTGTVIIISHDRSFLDSVATSTIAFDASGNIHFTAGGYADWHRKEIALAAEERDPSRTEKRQKPKPQETGAPKRLGYMERRELDALPGKIEALEAEEAQLSSKLCDPGIYRKPPAEAEALRKRIASLREEIDNLTLRWAELDERA